MSTIVPFTTPVKRKHSKNTIWVGVVYEHYNGKEARESFLKCVKSYQIQVSTF